MIHSLSGGVIKSAGKHTFVKVQFEDSEIPEWLVCDEFHAEEGDYAVAEGKISMRKGKIIRVDKGVPGDSAPMPLNKMKKVEMVLKEI